MSFEGNSIEEARANGVGVIKIVGEKVEYNTDGITTHKIVRDATIIDSKDNF